MFNKTYKKQINNKLITCKRYSKSKKNGFNTTNKIIKKSKNKIITLKGGASNPKFSFTLDEILDNIIDIINKGLNIKSIDKLNLIITNLEEYTIKNELNYEINYYIMQIIENIRIFIEYFFVCESEYVTNTVCEKSKTNIDNKILKIYELIKIIKNIILLNKIQFIIKNNIVIENIDELEDLIIKLEKYKIHNIVDKLIDNINNLIEYYLRCNEEYKTKTVCKNSITTINGIIIKIANLIKIFKNIILLNEIQSIIDDIYIDNKKNIDILNNLLKELISIIIKDIKDIKEIDVLVQNINNFISSITNYKKNNNLNINKSSIDSINSLKLNIKKNIDEIIKELINLSSKLLPLPSLNLQKKNTLPQILKQSSSNSRSFASSSRFANGPSRFANGSSRFAKRNANNVRSARSARHKEPLLSEYSGLNNCGNGCYMNSSIQLLFSIPLFNQIIKYINSLSPDKLVKNIKFGKDIYEDPSYIEYVKALNSISDLFETQKGKTIDITKFYPILYIGDKFSVQDATQFINNLLDNITEILHSQSQENPFEIKIKSVLSSMEAPIYTSEKTNSDNILHLVLNKEDSRNPIGLNDLIKKINIKEITDKELHDFNNKHAFKQLNIEKTSQYLLLDIKRFDNFNRKLNNQIVPEPILRINDKSYKLKSCIVHFGKTTGGGHYIYINFNDNGEPMHVISDTLISNYNNEDYIKNGYIYLYEQIHI